MLCACGLDVTGLIEITHQSGSSEYALKEFLNLPGTLAANHRYRPTFYAIHGLAVVAGIGMNFLHIDPIKALLYSAAINGLVAGPLLVLIVLLGSDRKCMESRVSGVLSKSLTWLTAALMLLAGAALIVTSYVIH